MSTSVVSIRLPSELAERIEALSVSMGSTSAAFIEEAVQEHIQEVEYAQSLHAEARAYERGELTATSLQSLLSEFSPKN